MIFLIVVSTICVSLTMAFHARKLVLSEIIKSNESRVEWAGQYLDDLTTQLVNLFYAIQINQSISERLDSYGQVDERERITVQKSVRDVLESTVYSHSRQVDALRLYRLDSDILFTVDSNNSGLITHTLPAGEPWLKLRDHSVNLFFARTERHVSAYHGMYRFENQMYYGGMSARVTTNALDRLETILGDRNGGAFFLLNSEYAMLMGSSSSFDESGFDPSRAKAYFDNDRVKISQDSKHILFCRRTDDGSLALVVSMPLVSINQAVFALALSGIWIAWIPALVAIIAAVTLSLRITRPIVSLSRRMQHGSLEETFVSPTRSHDEIGQLESSFNGMLARINELIEEEYLKDIEVKQAQLHALRARINPHFLNNTLQLIGGMAMKRKAPEIYTVVQSVAGSLRYSLNMAELATLGEELAHAKNYLTVQQNRFVGRLSLSVSMDPALSAAPIPRLCLQPIVENAFIHGLEEKEGSWTLDLAIREHRGRSVILVHDNGVGIDREVLCQLRARLRSDLSSNESRPDEAGLHIGLKNVDSRLKLLFGSSSGIRVFSQPGIGTTIAFQVPLPVAFGVDL